MDREYTIYHLPGRKVGCTVDFKQRVSQYRSKGYNGPIEVLEKITGSAEQAGDRERSLAISFGYTHYQHYGINNWNTKLTPEQRSAAGKKGGKLGGIRGAERNRLLQTGVYDPEIRAKGIARAAELRRLGIIDTTEGSIKGGKRGGKIRAAQPDFVNKQVWQCLTHKKTMNLGQIRNHHSKPECVIERVK